VNDEQLDKVLSFEGAIVLDDSTHDDYASVWQVLLGETQVPDLYFGASNNVLRYIRQPLFIRVSC
jgi:hypothetical protein